MGRLCCGNYCQISHADVRPSTAAVTSGSPSAGNHRPDQLPAPVIPSCSATMHTHPRIQRRRVGFILGAQPLIDVMPPEEYTGKRTHMPDYPEEGARCGPVTSPRRCIFREGRRRVDGFAVAGNNPFL